MKTSKNSKIICFAIFSAIPCLLPSANAQTNIAYADADRMNKDGSDPWAYNQDAQGDGQLLVGDSSTSGRIFDTALLFDISSFDSEIASATSITFNIAYSDILGAGQDVTAYLFGTNATALTGTNSIGPVTFHDSGVGGSNAGTIVSGDFDAPGVATYTVTTIVQSLTSFDSLAVLLSANTTQSGSADDIVFYADNTLANQANGGAYLSIVPEPSAAALLAGMSCFTLLMLRRRR